MSKSIVFSVSLLVVLLGFYGYAQSQAVLLEDCNGNGIPDLEDIASGTSLDCNLNSVPDECDIAEETSFDCNANGTPDECDIAEGTSQDTNENGIPDECENIIPTLSSWGMLIVALSLLALGIGCVIKKRKTIVEANRS
jgi:hypothetical protein